MKLFAEPETFFPRPIKGISQIEHHTTCPPAIHARLAPHRRDLCSCIRPSPSALCKAWSRRAPTPRGVSKPIETSSPHLRPQVCLPDCPPCVCFQIHHRVQCPLLSYSLHVPSSGFPLPRLSYFCSLSFFVPAFLPVPSRPLPKPIFWSDLPSVSVSLSF